MSVGLDHSNHNISLDQAVS